MPKEKFGNENNVKAGGAESERVNDDRAELYRMDNINACRWSRDGGVKNRSLSRFDSFTKKYENIRIYRKDEAEKLMEAIQAVIDDFQE